VRPQGGFNRGANAAAAINVTRQQRHLLEQRNNAAIVYGSTLSANNGVNANGNGCVINNGERHRVGGKVTLSGNGASGNKGAFLNGNAATPTLGNNARNAARRQGNR